MISKLIAASLGILLSGLTLGQAVTSYQCSFDQLQRRIEILSEPGVTVPCEVHYYKDSEAPGTKQVLWTATTEVGYCAARADEFVAKLREWGWECNAVVLDADPEPATEPPAEPMSDDTETLAPAEE
jgi:hypothetical protein